MKLDWRVMCGELLCPPYIEEEDESENEEY